VTFVHAIRQRCLALVILLISLDAGMQGQIQIGAVDLKKLPNYDNIVLLQHICNIPYGK